MKLTLNLSFDNFNLLIPIKNWKQKWAQGNYLLIMENRELGIDTKIYKYWWFNVYGDFISSDSTHLVDNNK